VRLIREPAPLEACLLQLQQWIPILARTLARRMKVSPVTDLRPLLRAGCGIIAMQSALTPWVREKLRTAPAAPVLVLGLGGCPIASRGSRCSSLEVVGHLRPAPAYSGRAPTPWCQR
jgi:hypothetical protein